MLKLEKKTLDEYKTKLSANLKELLNIYSMNMLELAKKINVSYGSIYDLIESSSNPTMSTLFKISEYFNISIGQLLGDFPITNNWEDSFFKLIPIIEWNKVYNFLYQQDNIQIENSSLIPISSKTPISEKAFALISNAKAEPAFTAGTILVFEKITSDLDLYDSHFILVVNISKKLSMGKMFVQGNSIFLKSLNPEIPLQKLGNDLTPIAYLIQSKIQLDSLDNTS